MWTFCDCVCSQLVLWTANWACTLRSTVCNSDGLRALTLARFMNSASLLIIVGCCWCCCLFLLSYIARLLLFFFEFCSLFYCAYVPVCMSYTHIDSVKVHQHHHLPHIKIIHIHVCLAMAIGSSRCYLFCYSIPLCVCRVCCFFLFDCCVSPSVSVTFRQSYRWDSDWQFHGIAPHHSDLSSETKSKSKINKIHKFRSIDLVSCCAVKRIYNLLNT